MMKTNKIKVLQIGDHSWGKSIEDFENHIDIRAYWDINSLQSDHGDDFNEFIKNFDAVLILSQEEKLQYELVLSSVEKYSVLYDEKIVDESPDIRKIFENHLAYAINMSDERKILYELTKYFFSGQYGEKFKVDSIKVNPNFSGEVKYIGHVGVDLIGNFGKDFQPIISWRYNGILGENYNQELWLEYAADEKVRVILLVHLINAGSSDIVRSWQTENFSDNNPLIIENYDENQYYLAMTLKAKGEGSLRVGNLHNRRSRQKFGTFTLGGSRYVDDSNQEIMTYFNPGNYQPPLNVYFSGYRTAEGFEGYGMMKSLGHPFLLVTDPRLEGGAFYIGSSQLENSIVSIINNTLRNLGFKSRELIMSGLSMGTFGALYYSGNFRPKAVIVGKPLVNLGTMALNEKLKRPGGFGTSLDLLIANEKGSTLESARLLNLKFWQKFGQGNFDETLFAIAYMINDDYDETAYPDLLEKLSHSQSRIISKGIPGRHNDASSTINQWFITQYRRIMIDEF